MKKNKRIMLSIVALLITVGMVVGVSYALWQVTLQQNGSNVITTGCFKVEFTDKNPIHLERTYPISDEEGRSLTPYEFIITNTCDNEASYQVNLEILNSSTLTNIEYIREQLNEKESTSGSKILNTNEIVEKTLDEAKEAYKLKEGVLKARESKTYELRLWLDESTPTVSDVMNKTLNSKITIITSLKPPIDTRNMMIAMDLEKECYGETQENCRNTKNKTYTQGEKYSTTLKKIIFESEKNPIEGAIEEVDFSVNQDGSVVGYYIENENQEVTLYIQADGKIKMNENGSYYFTPYDFYESEPTYIFEGLENIDTSEVTNMSYMFYGLSNVTNLDLNHFNTRNVMDMSSMFNGMSSLISLDLSSFDTRNVINMSGMFSLKNSLSSLDVSNFDTSKVTDMSGMFNGVKSVTDLDVSNFDTSNVTNMAYMFGGMSSLASLDVSHFDTRNVTAMNSMFNGMSSLTSLDLSSFDTRNVTDMVAMFFKMSNLTNLDLSNFDTSNVTNMRAMFSEMSSLENLDLSHFDTRNVTDMSSMFFGMSSLTSLDLSNFDTRNVTDMRAMFSNSENLSNITYGSNFVKKSNSNITSMYDDCPANKPTHSSWDGVIW